MSDAQGLHSLSVASDVVLGIMQKVSLYTVLRKYAFKKNRHHEKEGMDQLINKSVGLLQLVLP